MFTVRCGFTQSFLSLIGFGGQINRTSCYLGSVLERRHIKFDFFILTKSSFSTKRKLRFDGISGLIRLLEKNAKKGLGAVVNNLTCVCILFATEKEHISGVNITVHVTDLLFYVAMVRLRV